MIRVTRERDHPNIDLVIKDPQSNRPCQVSRSSCGLSLHFSVYQMVIMVSLYYTVHASMDVYCMKRSYAPVGLSIIYTWLAKGGFDGGGERTHHPCNFDTLLPTELPWTLGTSLCIQLWLLIPMHLVCRVVPLDI